MALKPQFPISVIRRYRYARVAAYFGIAVCFWVAVYRPYEFPNHLPWSTSDTTLSKKPNKLVDGFDFPPVESESIKSVCGETQWNERLVFTCDGPVGGVGNIRNSVLNCIRYAISAGASLVVPSIVLRNTSDISHIRTGMNTGLSHMFDTQHFLDSLRLSCPSLKIYKSKSDIKDFEDTFHPISLLPESLAMVGGDIPRTGLPHPSAWRSEFYTWLEQHSAPTVTGLIIVDLGRSYLQYPIYSDGAGFALSFGNILKFRSDVRVLATKVLRNMAKAFNFELDLTQPTIPNAFFGVHLRTEKDAVEAWPADNWKYGRYDVPSKLYLEQAPRSNVSVIYVSSGNLSEIIKFGRDAEADPHHFPVTTKWNLLHEDDLLKLKRLEWDQQALVDFLVMLKASDFAGIAHSCFAWNVALKRHMYAEKKGLLEGPQMLNDELSQIYGKIASEYKEYPSCLWP